MRLLVLGGSGFLGRHVVTGALARGWSVTTFNRGTSDPVPGAEHVTGDRTRPGDLAALTTGEWDAVVDTWSAAPVAVRDAAQALEPVAARYLYVSSASVYADVSTGPSEATPTVAADPGAAATDYAADKRGAELAVEQAFGPERGLLARAGLILGPGEDIGRLPWWLNRLAAGGRTLAPGPPDLGLALIDARDVAGFLLDLAPAGPGGPLNVSGRAGAVTTRELLETAAAITGGGAELVWATPEQLAAAGVQPWIELPTWLAPGDESRGLLELDTDRAHAAGLRTRPVRETIEDTWAWLTALGGVAPQRPDRPRVGLDHAREQALLGTLGDR